MAFPPETVIPAKGGERVSDNLTKTTGAKRILITCDCVGGIWTYALDLSEGLRKYGFEAHLATLGPAPSRAQRAELEARQIKHTIGLFKLEWMEDPWPDTEAAMEWLRELTGRIDPTLLHFNGYSYAAADWSRPTLVAAHSCILSWWQAVKGEPAPSKYDEYHRRVSGGLSAASSVVAPSCAMLHSLWQHYGWTGKGRVIPNGRSVPTVGVGAKVPQVVSIGRFWDEAKGITLLEKIAPRTNWPIAVIGPQHGPNGSDYFPRSLHILGSVAQSEVLEVLSRAMIYAAPVLYEPFGLAILEAALCRCALILSDLPSLREFWDDAAIFVEVNNVREWSETINRLSADKIALRKHAQRARARALSLSADAMCQQYAELYEAMCEKQMERAPVVASVA